MQVLDLPGFGKPPAPQFSGFLDASAAEDGTKLHYWFAMADDATKANELPVVLWLSLESIHVHVITYYSL